MASSVEKEGSAAVRDAGASEEPVWLDLPAPSGWTKKYFFPKSGTPTKYEVVFTAPSGEKIHTRRHMEEYLKRNGGPKVSEFDWGNGETPRRSARIIEKAKAAPLVEHENEPPKKRGKKSASNLKASKGKIDDKAAEGSEVVQTNDEERIRKPAKETKKRWWNKEWKIGQSSE